MEKTMDHLYGFGSQNINNLEHQGYLKFRLRAMSVSN